MVHLSLSVWQPETLGLHGRPRKQTRSPSNQNNDHKAVDWTHTLEHVEDGKCKKEVKLVEEGKDRAGMFMSGSKHLAKGSWT